MTARRFAAIAVEARVEGRYRLPLVVGILALSWTVLFGLLPASVAETMVPFVLLLDTATIGTFFVAALVLFERSEGVWSALVTSPLRFGEYLTAKLLLMSAWAVLAAIPIALAANRSRIDELPVRLGLVVLGVILTAVLLCGVSFAIAWKRQSVTGFLTMMPWAMIPLLGVPVLFLADVTRHPLTFLIPTTGTAALVAGNDLTWWQPAAITGYCLMWIVAVVKFVQRRVAEAPQGPEAGAARKWRPRRGRIGQASGLLALARTDLRNVTRDSLLVVVAATILLLPLVIRLAFPAVTTFVSDRYGVDLSEYRAVVLAFLVVLHVPMMIGMVAALVFLDEQDDRILLAIRVTPVTIERYLVYRAGIGAVLAFLALLVLVPLSGLVSTQRLLVILPALALAALIAPMATLAIAAFAGNRVEGLGLVKLLGIPVYAPVAAWFVPSTVGWIFGISPAFWPVRALWSGVDGHLTIGELLAGTAFAVLVMWWLGRRAVRRMT